MNKIFINIAGYRDPELIPTVKDAIKNATQPERLFFGICWQFSPDEPEDFGESTDPLLKDIYLKYIRIPANQSRGMNWARKLAHGFYRNECNYYLQIDSHMRFSPGWDNELIRMIYNLNENDIF